MNVKLFDLIWLRKGFMQHSALPQKRYVPMSFIQLLSKQYEFTAYVE